MTDASKVIFSPPPVNNMVINAFSKRWVEFPVVAKSDEYIALSADYIVGIRGLGENAEFCNIDMLSGASYLVKLSPREVLKKIGASV